MFLLLCHCPLSSYQFAKEKLPEALWEDPAFKNGCSAITYIWAIALMAMTIASAVEPALSSEHYASPLWIKIVFSYILQLIPLGLAIKYTVQYIQTHREEIQRLTGATDDASDEPLRQGEIITSNDNNVYQSKGDVI